MGHELIATPHQVLKFIYLNEVVTTRDLMNAFGYSRTGAINRLCRLRDQRLLEYVGKVRGRYGITEAGERRLAYYEHRERERVAAGEA
jgi:predicted HTH transcriptional regulator